MDYKISEYTWVPFDWFDDALPYCNDCAMEGGFDDMEPCDKCAAVNLGGRRLYFQPKGEGGL